VKERDVQHEEEEQVVVLVVEDEERSYSFDVHLLNLLF
jgi:hypothetical protein